MDIQKLIAEMTLEEKAGLCSGSDFWHTKAIERLGIPRVMVSDGPHGLRKQAQEGDHLGINDSIKAVCFPTGSALASSFDRDLIYKVGEALGDTCQAEDVAVILGPGVNIKRSPLCGRNFEYFSEDPCLAGEIAASQINGVQSRQIGTSLKHYLANSQEKRRMSSSSNIDERTLREIYLPAFETAVKKAQPWTVMCSYNRINGVYASESHRYLREILRDEWGFQGLVVSDWGAVNDRVAGIAAGLDLEMPASHGINDARIVAAVRAGTLAEADLDQAVANVLKLVGRYQAGRQPDTVFDKEAQHELAREVASQSMVLLKNEAILPLSGQASVAFIGQFAEKPRFQGGGSSHINAFKVTSALDAVAGRSNVRYAAGYNLAQDQADPALLAEAVELARSSDVAVIFAGLPDSYESEGYDRQHLAIPPNQQQLIEAIAAVQPQTVVVLHNGSPVEMPWAGQVSAILEAYLGGQAVGQAVVDVLFGDVNPSGRLAETFPLKLEDNPSFISYGGEKDTVEYREGIFVGYRYYDKKKMDVLFPFGHGLGYTTFAYSNLHLDKTAMQDQETLQVSVDVTNTGKIAGHEVVQLYVADVVSSVFRPVRELKDFAKIYLEPGQTRTVSFSLGRRAFAYYNTAIADWHVESGEFLIQIGRSSRDIVAEAAVQVESAVALPVVYTINSTFGDLQADPQAMIILAPLIQSVQQLLGGGETSEAAASAISNEMMAAMLQDMPLRAAVSFGAGRISFETLEQLLARLNQRRA